MPRERSRSIDRNHRRERHRDDHDRSRDKESRHKSRHRHRSRSPRRRDSRERDREGRLKSYRRSRSHSRSHSPTGEEDKIEGAFQVPVIDSSELEGKTEDEIEMLTLMGFSGFDTTKGKPVAGNDVYVTSIQKKRKYRQYMNRRGGFNRPLDAV